MSARDRAAEVAEANEIVMTLLEALPGGDTYEWEDWMVAARAVLNRRQQLDAKAAQRLQLVVAGQWLGHAADQLGGATTTVPACTEALDYLRRLGGWLADGASGEEPKP